MFTRQYYERIARAIRESDTKEDLVDQLINYFSEDNPRFDRKRFLRACGIVEFHAPILAH